LCGEKAVTFHGQCGSGWLGPGRIYFLERLSPRICADQTRIDQTHPRDTETQEKSDTQVLY